MGLEVHAHALGDAERDAEHGGERLRDCVGADGELGGLLG